MKLILPLILFLMFLAPNFQTIYSQGTNNKSGGICFRIDDNQPDSKIKSFSAIFNKYDFKFDLALNAGLFRNNAAYISTVKTLQLQGHELMDHTPDHITSYFTADDDKNTYWGNEGVDHINNNKICLKYDPAINLDRFKNEGTISLTGNMMISTKSGEFSKIDAFAQLIYIPSEYKVYTIEKIYNKVTLDPDTLVLKSFWSEPVSFTSSDNIEYHVIDRSDVHLTQAAVGLLFERSRSLFEKMGIEAPKVWAQPGATCPLLRKSDFSNSVFEAAATVAEPAKLYFNEYDPQGEKSFAMDWGQITPERSYFKAMKSTVANRIAKHQVLIASGHFNGDQLNGWNGFLSRTDSLLYWCKQMNIPVLTYSEWSKALYKVVQNPYTNVFPQLNKDLDVDGLPDGFDFKQAVNGILNKEDGAQSSGKYSLVVSKPGIICQVNSLAGLEKGENEFSFWSKASAGSLIEVVFSFPEIESSLKYSFQTTTEDWVKYTLTNCLEENKTLSIPSEVSYADITIKCVKNEGNPVKISGMKLMAKGKSELLPPWGLKVQKETKGIKLDWTDNSENEDGFVIERKIGEGGDYLPIDTAQADQSGYIDSLKIDKVAGKGYYRIKAYTKNESSDYTNEVVVDLVDTTSNTPNDPVVYDYTLYQNYPNPFNPSTLIAFNIAYESFVEMDIFNIMGERIETLFRGTKPAGRHELRWDAEGKASGVYLYRISAVPQISSHKNYIQSKKMILLH